MKSSQTLSYKEARRRLKISSPEFNALRVSELLGPYRDRQLWTWGVENYERYGTQWYEKYERMIPEETYENTLNGIPEGDQPLDTQMQGQIFPKGVSLEVSEKDTGWLAHFYLRPNRYFWPSPTDMGMVGPLPLKLAAPRKVKGTELPVWLYPEPTGSMGMVMVKGISKPADNAFDVAYDIAFPVLDELSFEYDQPLPIAHSFIVGVPSGVMYHHFSRRPVVREIESGKEIRPRCPYPQLQDAVALYREGISSNNPFHGFLTLWKAHENATYIRVGWRQRHKSQDEKVRKEMFPDVFAFGDFKGLNFEQGKQRLERPYRVALAHGGNIRDGEPLTSASAEDLTSVSTKLSIIRYMARVVIENVRATLESSGETEAL